MSEQWIPCQIVIDISEDEIINCYEGQVVNNHGIEYDLDQAAVETDFILFMMMDYWDAFVVPVADEILIKVMEQKKC